MRVCTFAFALVAAGVAAAANAEGDAKINFQDSIRAGDGSRIEVTGSFRADPDLDANGAVSVLNEATVEIEIEPPPDPDRPAQPPGPPVRLRVSGFATTHEIDPCWMPGLVLLALGATTPDEVERTLGFSGTVTSSRGFVNPPDPDAVLRVLGLLIAQANTLNPQGAARASRLVAAAFGLEPPPDPDSVCLPEPARQ